MPLALLASHPSELAVRSSHLTGFRNTAPAGVFRPRFAAPWRRLQEDLEAVRTDKVSLECLLREKLERLVQSEIEARVAHMRQVIPPPSRPMHGGGAALDGGARLSARS